MHSWGHGRFIYLAIWLETGGEVLNWTREMHRRRYSGIWKIYKEVDFDELIVVCDACTHGRKNYTMSAG